MIIIFSYGFTFTDSKIKARKETSTVKKKSKNAERKYRELKKQLRSRLSPIDTLSYNTILVLSTVTCNQQQD